MKALSLYVDKWFITVAVNLDGNVIPLALPNGEDRIWLFFHEDTANNRVVYGKTYEDKYRDKEPHYFGDIFPLIETGENHFTRYDNRPEEMRKIFKVANIFSHLHDAIQEEGEVDTYISFSTDISDIARLKFLQELKESNFNVIESVARISHLGLEESKMRGIFISPGIYLSLVATNDNLHFSLYKLTENLFVRMSEATLEGFGLDVRKRALIESVVENINRTTRFLSTTDEFAKEYKRQERFADKWLRQIANRRFGLPVTLPNITFAVAPNNPYSVTIEPVDLDQRTVGLVDDIVRKIAEFVRSNNVQPHEIAGITFIGNTFTNTKFTDAINSRFIVDENKLVKYREVELPKVVSVYAQIDCSQFTGATADFVKDAELQEELKRQAREEAARKEAAQAAAQKELAEKEAALKSEKEYNNAIENIERYESEHDYENMREWAGIALTHRPEDEYAKEKQNLAQQLLAEQRANNKQFSTILQRIKTAYSEGRWNDAISQCDIALELRPDSEEVMRIKRDSKRQLDIKEKVTNFLNRAHMFFAQKLYNEALEEVGKVLNLDSSNEDAKLIKRRISELRSKQKTRIQNLVKKLNEAEESNDFDAAIQMCDALKEEDAANLTKWAAKTERIKTRRKELEENKRKLDPLKEVKRKWREVNAQSSGMARNGRVQEAIQLLEDFKKNFCNIVGTDDLIKDIDSILTSLHSGQPKDTRTINPSIVKSIEREWREIRASVKGKVRNGQATDAIKILNSFIDRIANVPGTDNVLSSVRDELAQITSQIPSKNDNKHYDGELHPTEKRISSSGSGKSNQKPIGSRIHQQPKDVSTIEEGQQLIASGKLKEARDWYRSAGKISKARILSDLIRSQKGVELRKVSLDECQRTRNVGQIKRIISELQDYISKCEEVNHDCSEYKKLLSEYKKLLKGTSIN